MSRSRSVGGLLCAGLCALLVIPSCNTDVAMARIRVAADGSAIVELARLATVSRSEEPVPWLPGATQVEVTRVGMDVARARVPRIDELRLWDIEFDAVIDPKSCVLRIAFPSSSGAEWRRHFPSIDVCQRLQSLRSDPFKRHELDESAILSLIEDNRRLQFELQVEMPGRIISSTIHNSRNAIDWELRSEGVRIAGLSIPIEFRESSVDGSNTGPIVWVIESER